MTWATAPLAELCEIHVGRTPARANAAYWGPGEPWLSIADMNQGSVIRSTKEQITHLGAQSGYRVTPGTVLLSFKLSIGKVAIAGLPLYTNEAIAALPIKQPELLLPEFLVRALEVQDLASDSNRAAMGATLNKAMLQRIRIPLPPIDEQRRIAAILDQAEAVRAKRRQAVAHLRRLTESTFESTLAQSNCELATIANTAEVSGGLQVSAKRRALPLEVSYVRVANVFRNRLVLDEIRTLRVTAGELQRTRLLEGDVLVVEGHGNPAEVGRAAVWVGAVPECVHQNHLIRLRFDDTKVLPEFGSAWLNSREGRRHLLRAAKTTSGLNTISTSNVKSAPVPLMPLPEQQRFVGSVAEIRRQMSTHERDGNEMDALFDSLRTRAFAGAL